MSSATPPSTRLSPPDRLLASLDHGLRTMFGHHGRSRATPRATEATPALAREEQQLSGALMRVNHVGEICAQALYQSQALVCRDAGLREHFLHAAREEEDHLAWTRERLDQLNSHVSRLSPLWWGGAFAFGTLAGLAGDKLSLGFVVETERQVEEHLAGHLDRLPAEDHASRAIVAQMKEDEARHADEALAAGAQELPAPIKGLMRLAAKVMTVTAHRI
ncbi:2-polyprenyl-3-methyl-6-methoxy-1,4-benzoquinone monooxygenase [Roseateles sp. DAIF2]|uniref:2-polyprenyl-3-methyl-6-methoxy-1,4-benzoquinone monooxygenase n=1 Tax=Roseateles sp. DAIF2 TaxID=2714952 RepID=UPI0018A25995|nr:2-polyprenyl-3-methyl-6-methoxy-1,4-benzoquinone monooxygenase [Roseateles sp. DAIF2]QPF72523.1 2-polyprenyl-3-methyl-6-methoxy-1,4-benzoquinone monooxygenase [Roseateles sp. DAIF2]